MTRPEARGGHHGPEWLLAESWRQVQRAQTPEDRARALSTFRRMIATAAKQSGEASPALLLRIDELEEAARALYDQQQDAHVRKAIRALGSLRMAVEARLQANVAGEPIMVRVLDSDGKPIGSWQADKDQVLAFYGVPQDQRDATKYVVQLHFGENATSDVRAYRGRKLAWRSPSKPAKSPRRRALSHEEPPSNGHHRSGRR